MNTTCRDLLDFILIMGVLYGVAGLIRGVIVWWMLR